MKELGSLLLTIGLGASLGSTGCAASQATPEDRAGTTAEAIVSDFISLSPDGRTLNGVGFSYHVTTAWGAPAAPAVVQLYSMRNGSLWIPEETATTVNAMYVPPYVVNYTHAGDFSAPRPPSPCGSYTYYAAKDLMTGRWSNMVPYLNSCVLHAP